MSKSEHNSFPEDGELLIGTCTQISNHGAYFILSGYEHLGKEAGFVHISELSKTWVRQIRQHIQLNQRVVAKVLRVNPARGEVDLSVRRVPESQRRTKLQDYKHERRAVSMVKAVHKKSGSKEDSSELIRKLYEIDQSIYNLLLIVREEGVEILKSIKDAKIAKKIYDVAVKELEPPSVNLIGIASVSVYDSNGIKLLTDTFNKAIKETITSCDKIDVAVISSPDYRVIISAEDWKIAESSWKTFQDVFIKEIKQYNADYSFKREKS